MSNNIVNIADELFERCRSNAKRYPKGLAEIFEQLIWATDDNGSEIMRAIENWLRSDDVSRIKVAFEITEVFPFRERSEMDTVLQSIKDRWPDLSPLCERIANARPGA